MPDQSNLKAAPRHVLPIFYVLDTSGSMTGAPIEQVNRAMEETIDAVKQIAAHNGDASVKVAVLTFNTTATWLQPSGPEDIEDFVWTNLDAGGLTYMGEALYQLGEKLTKDEFLRSSTGLLYPIIIFMTDGYANDEWEKALAKIEQNKYFLHAIKVGFAVGDNADVNMIAHVVGNSEAVIKTLDLGLFAKMIRMVSVTSVKQGSVSHTSDENLTGADVIQSLITSGDMEQSAIDHGVSYVSPAEQTAKSQPASEITWDAEEW